MRLLKFRPLKTIAQNYIDRAIHGPDVEARSNGKSYIWARATNTDGESTEAWLETIEAYKLTALGAIRCVERVLDHQLVGTFTPAGAFGADLVLEIPGTKRYDKLPNLP